MMNINSLFVATVLFAASASAVNTEPILRDLAVFSFDNAESAAKWGKQILVLKEAFDKQDEGARKAVGGLYDAWKTEFAEFIRDDQKLEMSESQKMDSFVNNLWSVAETNVRNPEQKHKWWQSLNRFAQIDFETFKRHYLTPIEPDFKDVIDIDFKPVKLIECLDWDAQGKVTPVKHQGSCGSCWAHSAAAAAESNYLIRNGQTYATNPIDLSEQQLVDCVRSPRTRVDGTPMTSDGCDGGHSWEAMEFIYKYGIYPESKYPYTATDGTCKLDFLLTKELKGNTAGSGATSPGWGRLSPSSDPEAIKTALHDQTLSHYIRVEEPFQLYNGGVFDTPCTSTGINHATLFYGYCDSKLENFGIVDTFKIKNSWGTGWGENGKMRLEKTSGSGICEAQKYVWVDEPAEWKLNPLVAKFPTKGKKPSLPRPILG